MKILRIVAALCLLFALVFSSSVLAITTHKAPLEKYVIESQNTSKARTMLFYSETQYQVTAIYYPITTNNLVNDQIRAYLENTTSSLAMPSLGEAAFTIKPTIYGDFSIYSYSPEIISIKFDLSLYGGNEPIVNEVHTLTYNLTSGRALGREDLFMPDFEAAQRFVFTSEHLICFIESDDGTNFIQTEIALMELLGSVKFRVLNGADPYSAPPAKSKAPKVALTFDDGPHPEYTAKILNELKKRNAVATFYLLGESVKEHPLLTKRIVREGSEIGNHSWDHPNLALLSQSGVISQVKRTNDIIEAITGRVPKTMRPPYGFHSPALTQAAGVPLVLWSVDPADWQTRNAEAIVEHVASKAKNGDIILLHDIYVSTVEAVGPIVDALKARGFELVTVSELLSLEDYPINALSGIIIHKK